jgi:hypothetical protein
MEGTVVIVVFGGSSSNSNSSSKILLYVYFPTAQLLASLHLLNIYYSDGQGMLHIWRGVHSVLVGKPEETIRKS